MTLPDDDKRLLGELCEQHGVSTEKVLKLLEVVRDYELKERRTGVYDAIWSSSGSTRRWPRCPIAR